MNKAFRPRATNKQFAIKYQRKTGHTVGEWNWMSRTHWFKVGDQHRKHSLRVFEQLHYLGSHAPLTIRKKWSIIERQFINKRVPQMASFRYTTQYSSGRWL